MADEDRVEVKLLPCPFCGHAVIGIARMHDESWFAECDACGGSRLPSASQAEAITAWNTRSTPQASPDTQLREALEPFAELCENFVGDDEDDFDSYAPNRFDRQKQVTVGMLRKAVTALQSTPAPESAGGAVGLREAVDALLVNDPNWIAAGIPDDAIEAGIWAMEQAEREMEERANAADPENYRDWDQGMLVAAIFKAVGRAALSSPPVRDGGEGKS